jgi:hypothetical protein
LIPFSVFAVSAALQLALAAAPDPATVKPTAPNPAQGPKAAAKVSAPSKASRAKAAPVPKASPARSPRPPKAAPSAKAPPAPGAPYDEAARYQLVREKCVRCHGFDRAVNTRLTPADWKRHMKKMSLRPNTAISEEQASAILEFLKSYSPQP